MAVSNSAEMPNCPQCGAELDSDDPAGLCPKCLIQGAFDSSVDADDLARTQTLDAATAAGVDDDFGRYQILRLLGEGGMGTVYLAEQREPIRRHVALKVVKLGMDTSQILIRFAHERQALAVMDHPNVARIFDAGATSKGRPYFVMEYIEGVPITHYCDGKRMTIRQRLELFLSVCRAVQHAHRKGVIHRDLKPSNVLVTEQEGTALPKVIDFGIAKATDQWAVEKTLLTQFGQMVGTPEYASPEQAEVTSGEVDESSDVYSLGVLLYELLIGAVPFDPARLRQAGLSEMLRIIREEEAPPLSRRLTETGDSMAEIAAHRQTDGASLRRVVDGDLNWITLKALEKVRERRYSSAAELIADIQRYLEHRAVLASPPSALYRTRKFLRRHKPGVVGTAAGLAFVLLSGVTAWSLVHRDYASRPKLTDKDTIVLADFDNKTGDSIFDGTLRQGLTIQLEQSPLLAIMDEEQMQRGLRLMGLRPSARITNQTAHEICMREGGEATIGGTIASLGKSYVITLQAVTCQDGRTLARQQIQAKDKEHVLNALGTAATALRSKLGESHDSIQKFSRPVQDQVTTPSLEALQSFSEAMSVMEQGHFLDAVPFLERSVALDPNFAAGYEYLAVAYVQAGDLAKTWEYEKKAFPLIDRVSEWERDQIAAVYYGNTGESHKEIDYYQSGIRNYPRYWGFYNGLGELRVSLGQYEEGLSEGLEATRLEPNVEPPYRRQLDAYMCLDRLAEARQLEEKLRGRGLGGARIHQRFLELAYVDGDRAAIDREIHWFAGKPEEYLSLGLQAADRNVHGRRRESRDLYQRAAETALRNGLKSVASEFQEADALVDTLAGNCQTARQLKRPALALAICGDAALAEKLAAETSRVFPNGTIWNSVQLPAIRAAIALNRDQQAKSQELLASAVPYERSYLEPVYLRGLAYLRLKKGAEAVVEFRKIVDHKGVSWGATWAHPYWGQYYSLSHLGLARGFALAGDTAKAKKAFQDFFELWQNADADIPILQQARAEYARLR
ncbi:MAG: protein kinase [Bryobacterales bacterium]|nr:protein kinase [Bryobacterales bacterium]